MTSSADSVTKPSKFQLRRLSIPEDATLDNVSAIEEQKNSVLSPSTNGTAATQRHSSSSGSIPGFWSPRPLTGQPRQIQTLETPEIALPAVIEAIQAPSAATTSPPIQSGRIQPIQTNPNP